MSISRTQNTVRSHYKRSIRDHETKTYETETSTSWETHTVYSLHYCHTSWSRPRPITVRPRPKSDLDTTLVLRP